MCSLDSHSLYNSYETEFLNSIDAKSDCFLSPDNFDRSQSDLDMALDEANKFETKFQSESTGARELNNQIKSDFEEFQVDGNHDIYLSENSSSEFDQKQIFDGLRVESDTTTLEEGDLSSSHQQFGEEQSATNSQIFEQEMDSDSDERLSKKSKSKTVQNVKNCPYKYVLRNTMAKVFKMIKESPEMLDWLKKICKQDSINYEIFLKTLKENDKGLRKQLETRAGLAKLLNESKIAKKDKPAEKKNDKRGAEKIANSDFMRILRRMLQSFIHEYGISYLTHSKISSEKGCYIKTFSTVLRALEDAQNLSSLKKDSENSKKLKKMHV